MGDPCPCQSRGKDEAGTDQRFLPQSSVFLGTSIEKGVRAIAGHCFSLRLPVKDDNFLHEEMLMDALVNVRELIIDVF